jgi:hypothetical protein
MKQFSFSPLNNSRKKKLEEQEEIFYYAHFSFLFTAPERERAHEMLFDEALKGEQIEKHLSLISHPSTLVRVCVCIVNCLLSRLPASRTSAVRSELHFYNVS